MHYHLLVGDTETPAYNVTYELLGDSLRAFMALSRELVLYDRDDEYFEQSQAEILEDALTSDDLVWGVTNDALKVLLTDCDGCMRPGEN
jgi:hypothetical protein